MTVLPPVPNLLAMPATPITASLKFLADLDAPLVYIPSKGGGDETDHFGNFMTHEVAVFNGRHNKMAASLDVEGFRLVSQPTAVKDFFDDEQIESVYHLEVQSLLAACRRKSQSEPHQSIRRARTGLPGDKPTLSVRRRRNR